MLNRQILEEKRNNKIVSLKQINEEKFLSFQSKSEIKCSEELASLTKRDDENEISFQIRKANIRQKHIDNLEAYRLKLDKRLKRNIKHLERIDKRRLSHANRIFEIDLLRGIIILGMIVDHLMYDFTFMGLFSGNMFLKTPSLEWLTKLNYFATYYWDGNFRVFLRVLGVVLLVFLCGVSSKLSKNNFKRGGLLLIAGILMTIALNIFGKIINNDAFSVIFATISALGTLIIVYNGTKLLYMLLEAKLYKRKLKDNKNNSSWKWIALTIALSIFMGWFIFRNAGLKEFNRDGRTLLEPFTGMGSIRTSFPILSDNPSFQSFLEFFLRHNEQNKIFNFFLLFNNEGDYCVYETIKANYHFIDYVEVILGLKGFGVDWLGLLPMLGYIFLGGFIGEILYKDKKSIIYYFFKKENRYATDALLTTPGKINYLMNTIMCPITVSGRNTILIYVFHQPVIFITGSIIFLLLGGSIVF